MCLPPSGCQAVDEQAAGGVQEGLAAAAQLTAALAAARLLQSLVPLPAASARSLEEQATKRSASLDARLPLGIRASPAGHSALCHGSTRACCRRRSLQPYTQPYTSHAVAWAGGGGCSCGACGHQACWVKQEEGAARHAAAAAAAAAATLGAADFTGRSGSQLGSASSSRDLDEELEAALSSHRSGSALWRQRPPSSERRRRAEVGAAAAGRGARHGKPA